MNLRELTHDQEAILAQVESGDFSLEDVSDHLELLESERNQKIENYLHVINRIEAKLKAKTDEIKRIEDYIIIRKFKEIYNIRDLIVFHLGIKCGLRRQEMINLNWNDLELDEGSNPYLKVIESKGKKSRIVYINDCLFSNI